MRNLVLLLRSGHTVRIALRENELTGNVGVADVDGIMDRIPAICINPFPPVDVVGRFVYESPVIMAYVENPLLPNFDSGPDDYQRITVESPGGSGCGYAG